ncbi:MAG: 1-deoxy-D-xylulose-5-phosphate reductoisomerase [Hyphomicrobiales bacterium]|nr:MAG: 1-deoxy-D-xylulose-5-phosphate reductoisomerase [Hyphomicrobiales bacterium]
MRLSVLGATGSIGTSTLDLVARDPERFELEAVTAFSNAEALIEMALRLRPRMAVIGDEGKRQVVAEALAGSGIEVGAGKTAMVEAATRPTDLVVAAITGAAGLEPTIAAIRSGTSIALANKECLVCAGSVFLREATAAGVTILPVDSEHNAIFQVFEQDNVERIEKIILTASGGPFRTWARDDMVTVTREQALKHPNWSMGAKITIDSATLMNKGLEVIEAFHLFPLALEQIDVLVHPQSVIHGMVQYADGSLLAQLGSPDMRTPISHCLSWPRRGVAPSRRLDLAEVATLTFERPDLERFPALGLARAALARGEGTTTVLNGANEIAVHAFLEGRIGFLDIAASVEATIEAADRHGLLREPATVEAALELDGESRKLATSLMKAR